MGIKFLSAFLVFGILFSFNCRDFMLHGKSCPLHKITANKEISTCHQQAQEKSNETSCDCAFYDKVMSLKKEANFIKITISQIVILSEKFDNYIANFVILSQTRVLGNDPVILKDSYILSTIRLLI